MLEVMSCHNVWMFSTQLSATSALHHIPLNCRAEAPEATVRPVNMRFKLHDVAARQKGPQIVFIRDISGLFHCVNRAIGSTGASCFHVKDIRDMCFGAAVLIMTPALTSCWLSCCHSLCVQLFRMFRSFPLSLDVSLFMESS